MPDDQFRVLFDHASDAHIIVRENVITDCNEATVRLLRATDRAQVLSVHPAVLSPLRQPDGRLSSEKSQEMDATARARGWHRFEWVHRKLDGEDFPVEVTLNAVVLDGRPGLVAVWHDLTERKRMEAALRQRGEELAAANGTLEQANERMRRDLEAAALVQQALLPTAAPDLPCVRFAWRFRPCDELGGDLLDVFRLDDRHAGFYVLDVTGHGVAASLLSVAVNHVLTPHGDSSFLRREGGAPGGPERLAEPFEVARRLNRHFVARGGRLQLFTLCCGIVDVTTREVRFVSAGHPGPLRLRPDGTADDLNAPALPIGVLEDVAYTGSSVRLDPGDRFFVYSDGIPEARSASGEPFGDERLVAALAAATGRPLQEAVDSLIAAAVAWGGGTADDDISVVALEFDPKPD